MQSKPLPTILLVEDQPLTLMGMKVSLEALGRFHIVGEAVNGLEAVSQASRLQPNVILMDVSLPIMDGIEASWKIKQEHPKTKILMFTSHSSADVVAAALGAGAEAFCLKSRSIEEVASAIECVLRGDAWIDPAVADSVVRDQSSDPYKNKVKLNTIEMRILDLLRDGMDSRAIAAYLKTDENAVMATMRGIIRAFAPTSPISERIARLPGENTERDTALGEGGQVGTKSFSTAAVGNAPMAGASIGNAQGVSTPIGTDQIGTSPNAATPNEPLPAPFVSENLALPVVGDIFAEKYLIESVIGSGGMAAVFRAVHMYMQRVVALKVLHPNNMSDPMVLREFVHESMSIACVNHKNIVSVYDFGVSTKGEPYLVMELVDGESLDKILKREQKLTLRRFINIFIQVCDALEAAHEKSIVHCDLKPANILIVQTEEGEIVKLADFGLAKMLLRDAEEYVEGQVIVSGTPAFMSPEQCTAAKLDQRTDVYSLGIVMFDAITGVRPFTGNTAKDIFASHFNTVPPFVNQVATELIPSELEICIAQMMLVDPSSRPQRVKDVRFVLEQVDSLLNAST